MKTFGDAPTGAFENKHSKSNTERVTIETLKQSNAAETFTFFRDLLEAHGFEEYRFPSKAYSEIGNAPLIVRREDPRNILTLLEHERYEVDFPENERYSNCVEWRPTDGSRGIQNTYLEGFTALNSVVAVIGFSKHSEDDLQQLPDATQNFYGLERGSVRSFKGSVEKDRVAFISLRIPGHLLPERELTEDELYLVDEYLESIENHKQGRPVMVHRVFLPSDQIKKRHRAVSSVN